MRINALSSPRERSLYCRCARAARLVSFARSKSTYRGHSPYRPNFRRSIDGIDRFDVSPVSTSGRAFRDIATSRLGLLVDLQNFQNEFA